MAKSHLVTGFPIRNDVQSTREPAIVVSPGGNFVATSHNDKVEVWKLSEGRLVKVKETVGNVYQGLAVSDHGYLAVGHGKVSLIGRPVNELTDSNDHC